MEITLTLDFDGCSVTLGTETRKRNRKRKSEHRIFGVPNDISHCTSTVVTLCDLQAFTLTTCVYT